MRSTLYLKFILIYIAFGFLSVFTVATLGSTLLATNLEKQIGGELYKEANLMAKDYLPGFFTNTLSLNDTQVQLNGMTTYLDADIWITDQDGTLLLSSQKNPSNLVPAKIENFNPAETGSDQYLIGNYHSSFQEEMITVIAPVTQGFYTGIYFNSQTVRGLNKSEKFYFKYCIYHPACHLYFVLLHFARTTLFHLSSTPKNYGGGKTVCVRKFRA